MLVEDSVEAKCVVVDEEVRAVGVHARVMHDDGIRHLAPPGAREHVELSLLQLVREDWSASNCHLHALEPLWRLGIIVSGNTLTTVLLAECGDRTAEERRVVTPRCALVHVAHRLRLGVAHWRRVDRLPEAVVKFGGLELRVST